MKKARSFVSMIILGSVVAFGTTAAHAAVQEETFKKNSLTFTLTNAVTSFTALVDSTYKNKNGDFQSGFDITGFSLFSNTKLLVTGSEVAGNPVLTDTKVTGSKGQNVFTTYTDQYTLSTGPLAAGNYKFEVDGVGNGSFSGSYKYPVSPVPEPETYLMLLAGLVLVGIAGIRKTKNAAVNPFSVKSSCGLAA